jgi:hypothetical protein
MLRMLYLVLTLHSSIIEILKQRVLFWYHEYLIHPGQTRTEMTIRNTMAWPVLTQDKQHGLFMFQCQLC